MSDRIYGKNYPLSLQILQKLCLESNNEIEVMLTYLTGFLPTVLINLKDHFMAVLQTI